MKKLFFSTIAVLAFSVSGMANESKTDIALTDCYTVAQAAEAAYKLAMGDSYTNAGGYAVFAAAYDSCESDNSRKKKNLSIH
jgi:hypothetical protein